MSTTRRLPPANDRRDGRRNHRLHRSYRTSTYTVTASTGTGDGTIRLNLVDNDSITDQLGNPLAARDAGAGDGSFQGVAAIYTIDKTAPTVSSINRANTSPTNAGTVSWTVIFSESVSDVTSADFDLVSSGLGGTPAITTVTPAGPSATYTVTASTGTGSGTLGLDLDDDDSIEDAAGNPLKGLGTTGPEDGSFTGEEYVVDRTAPTSSASSPQYANSSPITVTYSASDTGGAGLDEVELWVDVPGGGTSYVQVATDATPASPEFSYIPSAGQGTYQFYTRARDNLANYEDAPATPPDTSTIYDITAPTSSATSPTATNASPFTVTYAATDATSGVKEVDLYVDVPGGGTSYVLVDTDTTPASPSFSYAPSAGEGTYNFYTRARDNATNYESEPGSPPDDSTIYDITAPTSSATAPQYANTSPFTVTYTNSDTGGSGVAEVDLYVDTPAAGTNFVLVATDTTPASPSFSYAPSAGEGTYQFYTRARDNATNHEDAPGTPDLSTIYDTTAPTSTASSPQYSNASPFTVTYTASDTGGSGVDEVELWVDVPGGGTSYVEVATDITPETPSFSYAPSAGQGTYNFYTRARDNATNLEVAPASPPDTATIYDTTAPTSTATSPTVTNASPFTVTYVANDTGGSGVMEVDLYVDTPTAGTNFVLVATDTTPASPSFSYTPTDGEGTYSFYTRARDNATNYENAPAGNDDTTLYDTTKPSSSAGSVANTTTKRHRALHGERQPEPHLQPRQGRALRRTPDADTDYALAITDAIHRWRELHLHGCHAGRHIQLLHGRLRRRRQHRGSAGFTRCHATKTTPPTVTAAVIAKTESSPTAPPDSCGPSPAISGPTSSTPTSPLGLTASRVSLQA